MNRRMFLRVLGAGSVILASNPVKFFEWVKVKAKKVIKWRRYEALLPSVSPLSEGIVPYGFEPWNSGKTIKFRRYEGWK